MAESSTIDSTKCRNVESTSDIHLVSIQVKNIDGLTASVDFDEQLTNLTGGIEGGRTRLLNAFRTIRAAISAGYNDVMTYIRHYDETSSLVLTFSCDGRLVTWASGFREIPDVDDGRPPYYVLDPTWTFEDGSTSVTYGSGCERVEDEHLEIMEECAYWLTFNVITDIHEAMEHMSKLPYKVLGVLGVQDAYDISGNIGRLMPWLCCFSRDMSGCLVWLDDIFDGVHQLVIKRFAEEIGSRVRKGHNQYVMSTRHELGLVDTYPCVYFMHGKAVVISEASVFRDGKAMKHYTYAFERESDEWPYGWKRMLEERPEDVRAAVAVRLRDKEVSE